MFTIPAPAKINLTLEVLAKRPDGYHEIRSIIQTISLCDSLRFRPSKDVQFSCDNPKSVIAESLISKATRLLQQTTGCTKGARIEVSKRIPLSSGLGGDSSDGAITLIGLNRLWQPGLSQTELASLASKLGSDVPFFLYGGTALVEGRGERITPLPPLPHHWVVLVMLDMAEMPGKTKRLYASLKPNHYTDGKITENFVKALKEGKEFVHLLFNTFENVAFEQFPGLKVYKEHLTKLGVKNVHLAGSGPALFTLVEDKTQAERIYQSLQRQGMECYLVETLTAIINQGLK